MRGILESVSIPAELAGEFDAELRRGRLSGLWVLALTGTILFPLFIALDVLLYPDLLRELITIRAIVTGVALAALWGIRNLSQLNLTRLQTNMTIWAFVVVYGAGLDAIMVVAGGLNSPYYAGFVLLIIVLSSTLPLRTFHLANLSLFLVIQANVVEAFWVDERALFSAITANFFMVASVLIGLLINGINHRLRFEQFLSRISLQEEKARNERLLYAAMPEAVAGELLETGRFVPRHIADCTVVFSDFVGFTRLASRVSPSELVHGLDQAFSQFDDISTRHGLERIKTMGDSYMCAAAVLEPQPDHLIRALLASLEMLDVVEREGLRGPDGTPWRMRVGLHSGPVIAGVVGSRNFAYDLWGDAVNLASRMESTAEPGTVNVSSEVYGKVERFFIAEDRGFIPVRGKGPVAMSQILRLRPRYALDEKGRFPNDNFFSELDRWVHEAGDGAGNTLGGVVVDTATDVSINDFDPVNAFAMLIPEDQVRLRELAIEVTVAEGEVLFREGQDLSVLYLITRGLFGVRLNQGGVDVEVAVLGSGELLGELSFVSLEPAAATVVALANGAVLKFDLNELQRMHHEHPGFSARMFHSFALRLARRVRVSNAKLFSLGLDKSDQETQNQNTLTTPHMPVSLIAAVGDMQRYLRPYLDGSKDDSELPIGQVAKVCEQMKRALSRQAERDPRELHEFGTVLRREAYRLLMRSKLIQVAQSGGLTSQAVLESIRTDAVLSKNALGRQFEEWFINEPFGRAIATGSRFIGEYVRTAYRNDADSWRVTSLAHGPIGALFSAVSTLEDPGNIRLTCVDDDLESLSDAGRLAESIIGADKVSLVRLDVLVRGMIRSRLRLVPQDFIFFQALIKPVDEATLLDLLDEVHALLAPGGVFLLGQIHLPQDSGLFLEQVLELPVTDWSVDVMTDLVQRSAFGSRFSWLTPDESGLCSFIELQRDQ